MQGNCINNLHHRVQLTFNREEFSVDDKIALTSLSLSPSVFTKDKPA